MAVSRPLLLALIGVVLLAAAWFATSASRNAESTGSADAAAQAPAKPKAPAQTRPAAKQPRPAAVDRGVPAKVSRAIESGRTVVLFFFQPGAADDVATATAVRGIHGVKVFSVPVADAARYRTIVSGAGVSQAPAVVIANKKGSSLVEGYVDPASLAQRVADAR